MSALTDELRVALRVWVGSLGRLPLVAALHDGTLPAESCLGLFDAMAVIHAPLEREAAGPALAPVWDESARRLPALERDLAALSGPAVDERPALRPAALRALAVASQLRQRATAEPASLLGTLWALNGPDLATVLTRERIERVLQSRQAAASAYLATRDRWLGSGWSVFEQRAEALLAAATVQQRRQVVEAAAEVANGFAWVVEALYPLSPMRPAATAADLNPHAGSHGIAADLREVQAALLAGERSWRAWPYLATRYGPRGQRYTRSDSAWIVTLARHDQATVDGQIAWLGRLLAARGMPRLLLEDHLRVLAQELVQALPERAADYARLVVAADRLGAERRAHLDDDALAELALAFERRIGPEAAGRLPDLGRLLAAAVADEQAGLPRAVASLEDWLADPSRSPAIPMAAIQWLIQRARRLARHAAAAGTPRAVN